MASKTWFITGAGRGFGREFTKSALDRGDKVAATARHTETLDDLVSQYGDAILPITLDVTDRDRAFAAVQDAADHFGVLDVVVNNAGYGLFGAVEEITPEQLHEQVEVNLFGVLNVTQAVLPILRTQGHGHIIQISTIGGVAAFPSLGGYHASKWAVEGLTESLAQEVAGQGIDVTLVEPGPYGTDWAGSSAVHTTPNPAYDGLRQAMAAQQGSSGGGDPSAAGPAILKVADAENPPLRVFFGANNLQIVEGLYEKRIQTWKDWNDVAVAAQGGGKA